MRRCVTDFFGRENLRKHDMDFTLNLNLESKLKCMILNLELEFQTTIIYISFFPNLGIKYK